MKNSKFELRNRTCFALDAFANPFESSCSAVCPWEEVVRVSPGSSKFQRKNIRLSSYPTDASKFARNSATVTNEQTNVFSRHFLRRTSRERIRQALVARRTKLQPSSTDLTDFWDPVTENFHHSVNNRVPTRRVAII